MFGSKGLYRLWVLLALEVWGLADSENGEGGSPLVVLTIPFDLHGLKPLSKESFPTLRCSPSVNRPGILKDS